ncbi:MAG: hypothetical protein ABH825_02830, partial [Candidatus Omnitrophota bacterium]
LDLPVTDLKAYFKGVTQSTDPTYPINFTERLFTEAELSAFGENGVFGEEPNTGGEGKKFIQQTEDGGCIIVSSSRYYGTGNGDLLIAKLDQNGDLQWVKTLDGGNGDALTNAKPTNDGGMIITGSCSLPGLPYGYPMLVKLSKNGDVEWSNTFGEQIGGSSASYDVAQTSEGDYIITTASGPGYDTTFCLSKVLASGNLEWKKQYDFGSFGINPHTLSIDDDGNYLVGGFTQRNEVGMPCNATALKINSDDTIAWANSFSESPAGTKYGSFNSIMQTSDGGYVAGGISSSVSAYPARNSTLIKITPNGTIDWSNGYVFNETRDSGVSALIETSDGKYAFVGSARDTPANGGNMCAYLAQVDSSGNIVDNADGALYRIGENSHSRVYSLQQTPEGGFMLAGAVNFNSGAEGWKRSTTVIKIDSNGNLQ